jgi:hypothetical protein
VDVPSSKWNVSVHSLWSRMENVSSLIFHSCVQFTFHSEVEFVSITVRVEFRVHSLNQSRQEHFIT